MHLQPLPDLWHVEIKHWRSACSRQVVLAPKSLTALLVILNIERAKKTKKKHDAQCTIHIGRPSHLLHNSHEWERI
jgi:hypothetical protein